MNNPRLLDLLRNPVHFIAFGFGTGLAPWAPGTFGTLVAIPFYLHFSQYNAWIYSGFILLAFAVGVYWCGRTARDLGVHDHGGIVWDEVVGYLVTMLWVPAQWQWMLLGFILFRWFDIWKPWPIRWADQKVSGGLGIMLDDVLAGVYAALVLQAVIHVSTL